MKAPPSFVAPVALLFLLQLYNKERELSPFLFVLGFSNYRDHAASLWDTSTASVERVRVRVTAVSVVPRILYVSDEFYTHTL